MLKMLGLRSRGALPLAPCGVLLGIILGTACGGDDGATTGAPIVTGTLTLPGTSTGARWGVELLTAPGAAAVARASGETSGSASLDYEIEGAAAGTYLLLGFVDIDGTGTTGSTPGDYAGWYGHTGDGNPPSQPNVVVPASGTVRFDWMLVTR
jgi:hypothetical protein